LTYYRIGFFIRFVILNGVISEKRGQAMQQIIGYLAISSR